MQPATFPAFSSIVGIVVVAVILVIVSLSHFDYPTVLQADEDRP
jgi:hypothetical protein